MSILVLLSCWKMSSEIALLQFFIIIVFRKSGQLGEVVDN